MVRRLAGALCLLVVLTTVVGAGPDDERAHKALDEGQRLLKQGKRDQAVRVLRHVLRSYPESEGATAGRKLLASIGFGLHCEVVFRERDAIRRLDLQEGDIVLAAEEHLRELWTFYRQTYPRTYEQDYEILVLDSRARFRRELPEAGRRSAYRPLPMKLSSLPRGQIVVFHDARLANRRDDLDILNQNIAREMALSLQRGFAPERLPEVVEIGLAEYLSVRLFPRDLVGVPQTPEEITRGMAREGLARLQELEAFRRFLLSSDPEGKVASRLYGQWVGLAYSLIDCLLHAALPSPAGGTAGSAPSFPRNVRLQAFLREYQVLRESSAGESPDSVELARLALTEKLLKRHFQLTLESFHTAWVQHVQRYAPNHPDYGLFTSL